MIPWVPILNKERLGPRRRKRRIVRLRRSAVALVLLAGAAGPLLALRSDDSASALAIDAAPSAPAPVPPPPPPAPSAAPKLRLAAVGDIVMGSPPYGLPPDGGASFFAAVDDLVAGDVVVGNLEGTLSLGGSSKCGSRSTNCFAFRTPPSYARWLRRAGFTVMNLANNHAFDFGRQGQRETVAALDRVGLLHTGRPGEVAVQTVRGVRIALVGFAAYAWANPLTDIPRARQIVASAAREADLVVVTMHAGAEGSDRTHVRPGAETYLGEPRGDSLRFSHAVVEAGADLVVGHGPHVMRGMEFHRGRLIAYSMGNFAGYEVFGLGGTLSTSGVLQVTLRADGSFVSGRLRPTRLVDPGTPAPGGDAVALVARVSREDFGARAARISGDGRIRPPSGQSG